MPEPQLCPNCNREMPTLPPQGLCPACLLGGVLNSQSPPAEPKTKALGSDGPPPRAADASTDVDCTATHVLSEPSAASSDSAPTANFASSDEPPGDDRSLEPGTQIRYFGDYEIRGELGRGAMGAVYKARQISLNRLVALKMIRAGALAGDAELRRFQSEAEAVARLDHPHIVPIHEIGEYDGNRYFSMKLIGGPCLSRTLGSYALNSQSAAKLIVTIAEAVHHAHQRGILHRDLKPSNILLDEQGQPHVSDFGLAKQIDDGGSLTESGAVLGTPAYMAPEQAGGTKRLVTTLSDVYGLGAVLYALLTGKPPFDGDSVMETLDRVRQQQPVPPYRLNPKIPRDLEVICLKCLDKEPERRYASAQALAAELRRFLGGEPIQAHPVSALERGWRWCRRRPVIAGLTVGVVVAVLAGLTGTSLGLLAAQRARQDALDREQDALTARGHAERESGRAKDQTAQAEQRLYDSRMNLVQRYWEDYRGDLLQQGLAAQLPVDQAGIDRRGFEWFYWQRMVSSGHFTLKGHSGVVRSVAFSPDGLRIASAGQDKAVKVWNAETGQETRVLKGHTGQVRSVAFSPDGRRLAAASWGLSGGSVIVWDAETGRETLAIKGSDVAFSPDGKRIASTCGDWTVKLWDAKTAQTILALEGHTSSVSSMAFSPDGGRIASASQDKTVKVWDALTGRETLSQWAHERN